MSGIKVLHILNTGQYSGAENVAITIINAMPGEDCIYVSPEGSIVDRLNDEGIRYRAIGRDGISVKLLKDVIKEEKPDVIHAHDFTAGIKAAMATRTIPIVNHLHNNPPWLSGVNAKSVAYRIYSKRFSRILAVSGAVIKEYRWGNQLKNKSVVIGNPVNTEAVRRKADGTFDGNYDLIFLGRITEQKNPLSFVEIVAELRKSFPDIKAAMVGDGELMEPTKALIAEKNLESTIKMYGFVDNPYNILKASKILCVPSRWEGFGLCAIEALAFGKPVVAARVGGLCGIVDSKSGYLCKQEAEFVEHIGELLGNGLIYQEKADGAFQRGLELDNTKAYIDNLMNIYNDILER